MVWSATPAIQFSSGGMGRLKVLIWSFIPHGNRFNSVNSHELFAVGKRYQFVAWAYVIGLFVPVPFWLAYRYWPKLRTDYLYTPVIWYVLMVFWISRVVPHLTDPAITLGGSVSASTLRSSPIFPSRGSLSGGSGPDTRNGSPSTTIFLQLRSTAAHR